MFSQFESGGASGSSGCGDEKEGADHQDDKDENGDGDTYNHLTGSLPSEIGNQLPNLKWLQLWENNNIHGRGEADDMSFINLSENQLFGSLPSSIGSLVGLTTLGLGSNQFEGKIPSTIGKLQNLQILELSRNQFSRPIPDAIGNLSLLIQLGLESNKLEGHIPLSLGNCKKLIGLTVSENRLSGKIPKQLVQLPSLTYFLDLSVNNLSGSIPSEIKDLKMLSELDLSYNNFSGTITSSLGVLDFDDHILVAVKVLHLQNRGALKSFLAECEAWRNIRHRNLLKIITSCSSTDFQGNDFKALVYEFMSNGSVDVATALDYLHNRCETTIVHGDLKPSNILLDADMVAHVGDFGLARLSGTDLNRNISTGVKGTIGYAPPDHVIDVIDNDAIVLQSTEANAIKVEECMAATINIGVSCCMDSPPQRMKIEIVVNELQRIMNVLQNI
nr:leucine-rich repeat protein [Tanacetum cinerariifolium]